MKRFYLTILFLTLLFALSACSVIQREELMPTPITHTEPPAYDFEMHSISAQGVDTTLLFCGGEAMLIDNGSTADLQLIADYAKEKNFFRFRYAVYACAPEETVLSQLPADTVYAVGSAQNPAIFAAEPDTQFPFGESTVSFIRAENGLTVRVTYENVPLLFPLDKKREAVPHTGAPGVMIMRNGPDGVQSEIRQETLLQYLPESPPAAEYIGNRNTGKLHLADCYFLPAEKNKVYFRARTAAPEEKYSPCRKCMPSEK